MHYLTQGERVFDNLLDGIGVVVEDDETALYIRYDKSEILPANIGELWEADSMHVISTNAIGEVMALPREVLMQLATEYECGALYKFAANRDAQ